VLYIAGTGRSGSTLLAGILGQMPGVFNAGEIRFIWERGLLENRLCGCGKRFHDCEVWGAILTAAGPLDARAMMSAQARATRVRRVPQALLGHSQDPQQNVYREALGRLYRAIAEVTGSDTIVDSSKLPSYARVVGSLPGVEMRVVHLVRDPRAAAASWVSVKEQPDRGTPGTMERQPPGRSAMLWNLWNSATGPLLGGVSSRVVTVRYEDFVAEPRRVSAEIAALTDRSAEDLPFIDDRTVELKPNHTVSGNPDRLRSGLVRISPEVGSRKSLRGRDQAVVTALTLPLLVRYRYPVRAQANGSHPAAIGIQHLPEPLRTWRRVQRHWRWGRTEGFGRLVEEDELDPRERLSGAVRRRAWRTANPIPHGTATPVLLVGLQRSGTNMVARSLAASPEFEVRNENDRAAFDRFRLRPLEDIRRLVRRSGQRFVVLKPLIDSDRADRLLEELDTPSHPKALWTYRAMEGRSKSALSKFGEHNLLVVRAILEGRAEDVWQGRRVPAELRTILKELDPATLSAETAAAVIWLIRNSLFFDLGLDGRDDCLLVSYERLVEQPEVELRRICDFLAAGFVAEMTGGIARRSAHEREPLGVDPVVRQACDDLERRLEKAWSSPLKV
jgi:hypothetical protein